MNPDIRKKARRFLASAWCSYWGTANGPVCFGYKPGAAGVIAATKTVAPSEAEQQG